VNGKNECAQSNETLLKILCPNMFVVIHEFKKSDFDPGFLVVD
jgi:hypothetical protein